MIVRPPFTGFVGPVAAGGGGSGPSAIASIWEWWEPSREGLANNDPIATLTGQFAPGSGHNFTQATSARRPAFIDNQINSLGVARFVVANINWMGSVNPSALTAVHFFIVVKIPADPPATVQVPWAFGSDTGNPDVFPFTDGTILAGPFSTARKNLTNPAASLAAWRVFEVVSVSGEYTAKLDGTQIFTTATNSVGILSGCVIGAEFLGTTPWAGDIAGIYICSAKLSGGDRTTMINYINTRFGLSSS